MELSGEETLALFVDDIDSYYEQLVALYWYPLKAFALRRLGSPQDAEDLVQESFIRAYVALESYTPERIRALHVRAWLYKITWNLCCNYVTRSKTALNVSLDATEESLQEYEDERVELPEIAFEQVEQRHELEELLTTLPPHYSAVVNLYYFAEMSYQEIAEVLNQPIGTVKVYVHRGIRLLRKSLTIQGMV